MKAKHRHQLKENKLAHTVASVAQTLQQNSRVLVSGAAVVVLAILVGMGMGLSGQRAERAAEALLADAMVTLNTEVVPLTTLDSTGLPAAASFGAEGTFASDEERLNAALPKLEVTVGTYPDTSAGLTARYHMASTLTLLGRHEDAIAEFDTVVTQAGPENLYARMAMLGRADTEVRAGRLDEAVASWQALTEGGSANDLPQDAILMELGRAYSARGDVEDARTTFTRIINEFPTSPYSGEARRELDNLPK
jgi:TolA-binding protein